MLNVQVCSSNVYVLVLEGREMVEKRPNRRERKRPKSLRCTTNSEIGSETFAEMKKNRQSPQSGIELPRQTQLMLSGGEHQPHFDSRIFD